MSEHRIAELIHSLLNDLKTKPETPKEICDRAMIILQKLAERKKKTERPARWDMLKAQCDSRMDQLWATMEDRHLDQLQSIVDRGHLLVDDLRLAQACAITLYSEIINRKSQRSIDDVSSPSVD